MVRMDKIDLQLFQSRLVGHFSHSVSIIFTIVVLIIVFVISTINQKVNKSISYRLSIYILFGDLLFSISQLMAYSIKDSVSCYISMFLFLFSTLLSLFYALAIALNLQITLVHNYYAGRILRRCYHIIPFIASLIISILPFCFKKVYLTTGINASCWFENSSSGERWAYASNYGWIIFSIGISLIICLCISITLITRKKVFHTSFRGATEANEISKFTIIRILMFPAVPIICYTVLIIRLAMLGKMTPNFDMDTSIASNFFKGFQGFLNSSLFLYNNLLYRESERAVAKIYRSSELPPQLSHSKSFL